MKKSMQMIMVLATVGLVSGASLVGVYNYAAPRIERNKQNERNAALKKVVPAAERFEAFSKDGMDLYKGLDASGRVVGYAFQAEGNGYAGIIELMAGIDADLTKLIGIEIIASIETPGLGDKIRQADFRSQFESLSVLPEIVYTKGKATEPNEIQAITGATISSRSIVAILNARIEEIRKAFNK